MKPHLFYSYRKMELFISIRAMIKICVSICLLFLFGCRQNTSDSTKSVTGTAKTVDVHSFAKPDSAVVKHLDLTLKVDFANQILTGKAIWTIENPAKATEIIFDSKQLNIEKITLGKDEKATTFSKGKEVKFLGEALRIKIADTTTQVNIYYSTSKNAAALQWLNPQQTAGKKLPFLFTQSEAILARSWIPCQDSPGIRFTYDATVTVPNALLALMSAENPQEKNKTGVYTFKQPHAIPSYLMALAVGDIAFKATDNRSGIYAEPSVLAKASYEFADMGKMITEAEKLYGDYRWGRYDVLVLPPSFPFGGMENPMLTFATPTVIAGDRSLVSLIAHELAHSWSGNLVTNATWNDFWLNEGFTVYFERRILEKLYGKEEVEMHNVLGYQGLQETIKELGIDNADTRLKADFTGRDPDLGVSDIAYEKGALFIKHIENTVGKEKFDEFLRGYFGKHSFHSVTTEQFLADLNANLIKGNEKLAKEINADAWIYKPGLPTHTIPTSANFVMIDSIINTWKINKNVEGLKGKIKSTNQILYFISHIPDIITTEDMLKMDKEFGFTNSANAEIQCAWYTLAVKEKYEPAYPNTEKFLISVGRRKFILPIYKELIKSTEGKAWAQKIYAKARPNYHSVAFNTVDDLLKK
ncbi:MAG: Peptidase rane alanine aminopeptidase [Daejeonella sp.]|nr:Peptidase rane alanine aminopeptidase [Daejeonella sp.]